MALWSETSDDYQPLFHAGGRPVDVTLFVITLHVFCAVTLVFLTAFGYSAGVNHLALNPLEVINQGALWQIFTYAWVHPPSSLIWLAVELYMLFQFGREVERFVGRKAFILLYLVLSLVPAVLLTLSTWALPGVFKTVEMGSGGLHFSIFLAFAVLYPSVELFFPRISVQALAWVFLTLYSLMLLAYHEWGQMLLLWSGAGLAYGMMRWIGVGGGFDFISVWLEKRHLEKLQRERQFKVVKQQEVEQSMDSLLEKISKSGINSLTKNERATLERARAELLKKEKTR